MLEVDAAAGSNSVGAPSAGVASQFIGGSKPPSAGLKYNLQSLPRDPSPPSKPWHWRGEITNGNSLMATQAALTFSDILPHCWKCVKWSRIPSAASRMHLGATTGSADAG